MTLSSLGQELLQNFDTLNKDVIDVLTQDIIRSQSWAAKEFRSYDIKSAVPKIIYGKKHFENESIDYVKSIWLNIGVRLLPLDPQKSLSLDNYCLTSLDIRKVMCRVWKRFHCTREYESALAHYQME